MVSIIDAVVSTKNLLNEPEFAKAVMVMSS